MNISNWNKIHVIGRNITIVSNLISFVRNIATESDIKS